VKYRRRSSECCLDWIAICLFAESEVGWEQREYSCQRGRISVVSRLTWSHGEWSGDFHSVVNGEEKRGEESWFIVFEASSIWDEVCRPSKEEVGVRLGGSDGLSWCEAGKMWQVTLAKRRFTKREAGATPPKRGKLHCPFGAQTQRTSGDTNKHR
jgi:hypothetical protein